MKETTAKEIDKLQSAISKGNLADIALKNTMAEYIARARVEKLGILVAYYKEGKLGNELISIVAGLAALTDLENDLKGQVIARDRAHKRIEEIENEAAAIQYREY